MKVKYIFRENELNKILKKQKSNGIKTAFLFTSPWDQQSISVVKLLSKRCGGIINACIFSNPDGSLGVNRITVQEYEEDTSLADLYIVDSFITPHTFVIFKVNRTPALVRLDSTGVIKEDYLPNVYKALTKFSS